MADLRKHLSQVNIEQPNLNAPWVNRQLASVDSAIYSAVYRVGLIYHLTGDENRGQHNVFVDLVDNHGDLEPPLGLSLGWNWHDNHGLQPTPSKLDKQPPSPYGDLPIFGGAIVDVWLTGGAPSERVIGLRVAGYPELDTDAASGNYPGHNSYYVVFVRTTTQPQTPPIDGDLATQIAAFRADYNALGVRLTALEDAVKG